MPHSGFTHESSKMQTDDWITPKWIIDAFDKYAQDELNWGCFFYLDPCASLTQPWFCARKQYTIEQDGLKQPWFGGHVWLNPPYGSQVGKWAKRMVQYGDGIMLLFARVETKAWQNIIFPSASGILFPKGRIAFAKPNGTYRDKGGAPSALVSFGKECQEALRWLCVNDIIKGTFVDRIFTRAAFTK